MTKAQREQLEKLIAQLEDPVQVRASYVIPNGTNKHAVEGYKAGAQMEAKAVATQLRGIFGIKKEDDQ